MILSGTGVREPPEQQPQGSSVFLGRVSFSAPGSHTPYGAGDLLCLLREVGGGRLFRRRRRDPQFLILIQADWGPSSNHRGLC